MWLWMGIHDLVLVLISHASSGGSECSLVISLWIDGVSTILIMVRMYIRWSSDGTMAHGALSDGD